MTLNPYTGCNHACVYCYASGYTLQFANCRPKKDLLKRVEHEAPKLRGETVSVANSSDPYPPMEAEFGLTRRCLEILSNCDCKVQIVTKSGLVKRDADILSTFPCTVALTITTDDDKLASAIEPNAPPPSERLEVIDVLTCKGIPVIVRIDPVIPCVNDSPGKLIARLADLGVRHVTSSTYKVKHDNWQRFEKALPSIAKELKPLYFSKGEKIGGSTLLPIDLRIKLMVGIRRLVVNTGMKFGVCRENLQWLNTAECDGSWLLRNER